MNAISKISASERYARCVETSKRVRWDVDGDVIRVWTSNRPSSSPRRPPRGVGID
jgi:hypothetical protein